jgi:hypothetical protein
MPINFDENLMKHIPKKKYNWHNIETFFFFLVGLPFELRALHLQSRYFTA